MKKTKVSINIIGDTLFSVSPIVSDSLADKMLSSDFNICNYEGVSKMNDDDYNTKKLINLTCDSKKMISELEKINIKAVSLANNHFFDLGISNAKTTIDLLEKNKIIHSGISNTFDSELSDLGIVECNSLKIGLLSFGWKVIGCVTKNDDIFVNDIQSNNVISKVIKAKSIVDFLIVSFHWGYEFEKYPHPGHRKLAHDVIDAGADVIFGHHPHIIQGYELYKSKLIAYSLGNFFLPQIEYHGRELNYTRPGSEKGLILSVRIDEDMNYSFEFEGVKYFKDNHSLEKIDIDLEFLSSCFKLSDGEYITFFKKNRNRRKGLPIFYGNILDKPKSTYVAFRQKVIELLVKLNLR